MTSTLDQALADAGLVPWTRALALEAIEAHALGIVRALMTPDATADPACIECYSRIAIRLALVTPGRVGWLCPDHADLDLDRPDYSDLQSDEAG